jgi:hypothetical protein
MVLNWQDIAKFHSEEQLENFILSESINISKKKITAINCKYCKTVKDYSNDLLTSCRAYLRYLVCRCSSGCKMRYQTRICSNYAILRVLKDENFHDFHSNIKNREIKDTLVEENTQPYKDSTTNGFFIFIKTFFESLVIFLVIIFCLFILLKAL